MYKYNIFFYMYDEEFDMTVYHKNEYSQEELENLVINNFLDIKKEIDDYDEQLNELERRLRVNEGFKYIEFDNKCCIDLGEYRD